MSRLDTRGPARRLLGALALALLVATGCETAAEPEPVGVYDLRITPAVDTLAATDSARFRAAATDARGRPLEARIVWSTSDPSVAVVDSIGRVRAIAQGTALIAAVAEGKQASARLVVTRAMVASVRVEEMEMLEGTSGSIVAAVFDAAGVALLDREITYASTDPGVVEVLGPRSGFVIAHRPGTSLVIATSEGRSDTATATVRAARVQSAVLHPAEGLTYVGVVRELDVELTGDNQRRLDRPTRWSSADPAVAVVDSLGRARGVAPGTTVITAVSEGVEARMHLRVLPLASPLTFTTLSPQTREACAVDREGAAYCWGSNPGGSMGTGPVTERDGRGREFTSVPLRVAVGVTLQAVHPVSTGVTSSVAGRVCGLDVRGTVLCWGSNPTPAPLPGGIAFRSLDAGSDRFCGVSTDGAIHCWNAGSEHRPARLPSDARYSTVSVEREGVCALTVDGEGHCWYDVALPDDGSPPTQASRTTVPGGHRFRVLRVGVGFACGLTLDDRVLCWGKNNAGQLGSGTADDAEHDRPVAVAGGLRFRALDVGALHACAIDLEGRMYCWGYGHGGQLGNGVSGIRFIAPAPAPVAGGHRFATVHAGAHSTCAISEVGIAYCWGAELHATAEFVSVPREIAGQCTGSEPPA